MNSQFFATMKEQPLPAGLFETVKFGKLKGGEGQFLRNFLKLSANPIEDFLDLWPQNPPNFRLVQTTMCRLSCCILGVIRNDPLHQLEYYLFAVV